MSKLLTAEQLSAIRIAVCDQRSEWDAGDAAFIQYAESLIEHIDALHGEECNWYETRVNELWESECGIEYLTNTDGQAPCDCGFEFCPFCGKSIIENIMESS